MSATLACIDMKYRHVYIDYIWTFISVAYHYITKDKDSDNGVTVPTTHGIESEF